MSPPLHWRLRGLLPPGGRRAVRALTDPLLAPVGSVRGARTGDAEVALTFDDGPDPCHTPRVLDVLARHAVRATFFLLVERAEAHPALVARMVADGHEVALHGVDHRRLTRLDGFGLDRALRDGRERLETVCGRRVRWLRPPFGSQSLRTYARARLAGLDVAVWSADAGDWVAGQPEAVAARALAGARPGAILLLHDAYAADPARPEPDPGPALDRAAGLDLLLRGLAGRGYLATTVSGLLAGRRPHRTAWFRP